MPMLIAIVAPLLMVAATRAAPPNPPCTDPLPIDPAVVTQQMKLQGFAGATQAGPVCHLSWQGGGGPSLLIYGPTGMAGLGQKFTSARQAADQYRGESPKGVEPLPGVANGYMVFDPKTPNRRLFVEFQKKIYMIVSQDQIPLAVLAKAIIQK
ncbi:MAG TPA: hypothetical protein VGA78_08435 [Gemmatimonadales bacterium]